MGNTRDTGYLQNLLTYDVDGNIVLPANLTVNGNLLVATQSYVTTQINNLINGAPALLDTLDELAAALGDDANFASTITTSIAGKLSLTGGTLTGALNGTSANFSGAVSTGRLTSTGLDFHSFIVPSGTAQIKLERTGTSTGVMYIGADVDGFSVMNTSFTKVATISSSGAATFISSVAATGIIQTSNRLNIVGQTTSANWISSALTAGYNTSGSEGWIQGAGSLALGTNGTSYITIGATGTITANSSVTVNSNIQAFGNLELLSGSGPYTLIGEGTGVNQYGVISWNAANNQLMIATQPFAFGANGGQMTLSTNGNIGVGENSPNEKLVVRQTTNNTSSVGFYTSASTGASYGPLILAGTSSSDASLRVLNQAGSSTYLYVRGDGNVGIATTNPGQALDVVGNIRSNNVIFWNNGIGALSWDTGLVTMETNTSTAIAFKTNGQERLRIAPGGDVSISNNPLLLNGGYVRIATSGGSSISGYIIRESSWTGNGSSTNLALAAENVGGELVFFTGGQTTTRMKITSGGNVLIGTTTDVSYKLAVDGSIYLTNGGNRQIYIGSATNYNYRLRTDGDDFVITEAGVTDRLRYSYSTTRWIFSAAAIFSSSVTASGGFEIPNGQFYRARRTSGSLLTDMIGIPSGTDDVRLLTTGDFNIINGSLTNLMTVKNGGNVLIGTISDNGAKLRILGPNATGVFFDAQNDGAAGATFSRINQGSFPYNQYTFANGNVGIGTSSPQQTLSVEGAVRASRSIYSWYQAGTNNWDYLNFLHLKTNMWGGGSPNGNLDYTMSLFYGRLYSYSSNYIREGHFGFHNWSGALYSGTITGNFWSGGYISSDGYVVLVVALGGGSYLGVTIDWHQAYGYPLQNKIVTSAQASNNSFGVF